MNSNNIYHGVYMMPFGISTVVMATQSCIEWHMNEYLNQPDNLFCEGLGKLKLLKRLEYELPIEDKYFDSNPNFAVSENQRWKDFCDDCVILATLSAFLNNTSIILIHPNSYNPSKGLNSKYETPKQRPTFVQEIEVQRLN